MRRPLLALVLSGAVVLAACGSSGPDATTSSTTAKPQGTPADRRLGRAALLRVRDAPGYQQVAPQTSVIADLAASSASLPDCGAYRAANVHRVLTGRAAGLQRGTTVVDSSIAVYADDTAARSELELFRAPSMAGCLHAVSTPTGTTLAVTPLAVDALGDGGVGYRIARAAAPEGSTAIDVVVVRAARVVISVTVTGTAADTAEIERTALAAAVDRVRAATG